MKKLRLMLVALACLLGTALGQKASAATYYFQKPDGWDTVYVFWWTDGPANYPGVDAKKYEKTYQGKEVYYYTFDNAPSGMIFNNGEDENGHQTGDITEFTDGAIWILGEKDGDPNAQGNQKYKFTKVDNPTFDNGGGGGGDEPVYPEKLYLIGPAFGDWGTFSDTYSATPVDGVYTWTFTDGFTNQDFKVSGNNYSPAYTNERTDMVAGTVYPCPESDSQTNMKVSISDKKVTVKFDLTGATPTIQFITDGGGDDPNPPTPGEVNPDGPRTLYVSFGQERILSGNRETGHEPQIHFGSNTIDPDNDPRMDKVYTETDSPIWSFKLSDDQYALGDAVLYFELKDGGYTSYRIGKAGNRDEYNWTRYIYYVDPVKEGDTGDDSQNKVARQSYITEAQFKDLKYGVKTKLYITGEGFRDKNTGDAISGWAIRPKKEDGSKVMMLEGQNGVFTTVIEKWLAEGKNSPDATPVADIPGASAGTTQTGAKFKMGWIRPYDWCKVNYGKTYADNDINEDRCWATFNLGIVGIAESHDAITSGKVQVVRGTGNTLNTEVFCTPGRTIPVSRYNQSDWFIRDHYIANTSIDGKPVEYTLVVDLEPDCNTVTLLYFNPDPELTPGQAQINHAILTPEQAAAIHDDPAAPSLKAEKANPAAPMRYVNVATAEGTLRFDDYDKLKGQSPAGIEYNYTLEEFDIFLGDTEAGKFKPGTDFNGTVNLSLPGVAVGQDAQLGARAKFKAPSGLHFHTQNVVKPVSGPGLSELPPLGEVNVGDEKSYSYGTNNTGDPEDGIPAGESWYTLGAYALINCNAPVDDAGNPVDLYWYGDFELSCPDHYHADRPELANGGEIVGPGHHTTTLTGAVKGKPLAGYDPASTDPDAGNWADCMRSATSWPVHLPEVVKVTRRYADDADDYWDFTEEGLPASLKIEGNVYAVYPFLVQPDAEIVATAAYMGAPRRAPGTTVTIDPDKKYRLSYQAVATPVSFALTSGELTGVKDIITGASGNESEVEYYNLQGVRMHGQPAPGIYIRRQGASVEKVIIR